MPPAFAWFHSIESFPARISWKSIKSGSTWWFASPHASVPSPNG